MRFCLNIEDFLCRKLIPGQMDLLPLWFMALYFDVYTRLEYIILVVAKHRVLYNMFVL